MRASLPVLVVVLVASAAATSLTGTWAEKRLKVERCDDVPEGASPDCRAVAIRMVYTPQAAYSGEEHSNFSRSMPDVRLEVRWGYGPPLEDAYGVSRLAAGGAWATGAAVAVLASGAWLLLASLRWKAMQPWAHRIAAFGTATAAVGDGLLVGSIAGHAWRWHGFHVEPLQVMAPMGLGVLATVGGAGATWWLLATQRATWQRPDRSSPLAPLEVP